MTVAKSTSKFFESQMARLQGWCGLKPEQRHLVPEIWEKLQTAKDKDEAKALVIEDFDRLNATLEEPLNIYSPLYSWPDTNEAKLGKSLSEAVRHFLGYAKANGPFLGIYGFASGGVVAALARLSLRILIFRKNTGKRRNIQLQVFCSK